MILLDPSPPGRKPDLAARGKRKNRDDVPKVAKVFQALLHWSKTNGNE